MQATPQTDTVSPVTVSALAQYLRVEDTDPLLPALLIAATDAVIRHINHDLLQRTWRGVIPKPDDLHPQISPYYPRANRFELPYTGLVAVVSVLADGDAVQYEVEANRRPARITLLDWDRSQEVIITYTARMNPIPVAVSEAIKMMAAFAYEHRGDCDADEALTRSGAATLLRPYRVEVSI
jgi:hypothetical protein